MWLLEQWQARRASALLLRDAGGEVGILLRYPVDELADIGVEQQGFDIHAVALQLGVGEIGHQRLLTDRVHGYDVASAPALWHKVMPDDGLAGRSTA